MTGTLRAGALSLAVIWIAHAQQLKPELQQKLAAVKDAVARNQAALRQYTWTSHTEVSLNGDVKKTRDDSCRLGPDGKMQKTEIGESAAKEVHGPIRRRIVEHKTEELTDYARRAVALIHEYIPPTAHAMEEAFQAGHASLGEAGSGTTELQFKNYLKTGDGLTLSFNAAAKTLHSVTVNSYLDDPKDAIFLEVDFQTLPDGTNYESNMILKAPAKKLEVRMENSHYQKIPG